MSEISNLNISDFDFDAKQFLIHGKGNKERIGYLNNITLKAVKNYLEIRNKIITNATLLYKYSGVNIHTIQELLRSF